MIQIAKRRAIAMGISVLVAGSLALTGCSSANTHSFLKELNQEIQPVWTIEANTLGNANYTIGNRVITTVLEDEQVFMVAYDIADGSEVWREPLDGDNFFMREPHFISAPDDSYYLLTIRENPPTEKSIGDSTWGNINSESLVLLDPETGREVTELVPEGSDLNKFLGIADYSGFTFVHSLPWRTATSEPEIGEDGEMSWYAGYYESSAFVIDEDKTEAGNFEQALVPLNSTQLANIDKYWGSGWLISKDENDDAELAYYSDLQTKTVVEDPDLPRRLESMFPINVHTGTPDDVRYVATPYSLNSSENSGDVALEAVADVAYSSEGKIAHEVEGALPVGSLQGTLVEVSGPGDVSQGDVKSDISVSGEDLTFTGINLETNETTWETQTEGATTWARESYRTPAALTPLLIDGEAQVLNGEDGAIQPVPEQTTLLCSSVESKEIPRIADTDSEELDTINLRTLFPCNTALERIDEDSWSVGMVRVGNWRADTNQEEGAQSGDQQSTENQTPLKVAVSKDNTLNLFELPPQND